MNDDHEQHARDSDSGYESLAHTADAGIRVWAPSLDAMYAVAAAALFEEMGEPSALGDVVVRDVVSHGIDREDLLVRMLTDLLALFDIESLFVTGVSSCAATEGEEWTVAFSVVAARVDRATERQLLEIKAITYHELWVREVEGRFEAQVIFDL